MISIYNRSLSKNWDTELIKNFKADLKVGHTVIYTITYDAWTVNPNVVIATVTKITNARIYLESEHGGESYIQRYGVDTGLFGKDKRGHIVPWREKTIDRYVVSVGTAETKSVQIDRYLKKLTRFNEARMDSSSANDFIDIADKILNLLAEAVNLPEIEYEIENLEKGESWILKN